MDGSSVPIVWNLPVGMRKGPGGRRPRHRTPRGGPPPRGRTTGTPRGPTGGEGRGRGAREIVGPFLCGRAGGGLAATANLHNSLKGCQPPPPHASGRMGRGHPTAAQATEPEASHGISPLIPEYHKHPIADKRRCYWPAGSPPSGSGLIGRQGHPPRPAIGRGTRAREAPGGGSLGGGDDHLQNARSDAPGNRDGSCMCPT